MVQQNRFKNLLIIISLCATFFILINLSGNEEDLWYDIRSASFNSEIIKNIEIGNRLSKIKIGNNWIEIPGNNDFFSFIQINDTLIKKSYDNTVIVKSIDSKIKTFKLYIP